MDKYYSKTLEWVETDGEIAIVGVTLNAAKEVGDITFVDLPKEGTDLIGGDVACTIESVTSSSDVISPISGTVVSINHALEDNPGLISDSPEGKGWLYKLENIDEAELADLMSEEDYAAYLETL